MDQKNQTPDKDRKISRSPEMYCTIVFSIESTDKPFILVTIFPLKCCLRLDLLIQSVNYHIFLISEEAQKLNLVSLVHKHRCARHLIKQ